MSLLEWVPRLRSDLMRDFGLSRNRADGIIGQLAHESGGFRSFQEVSPIIPGSRGGWGIAQWTGPRRLEFESQYGVGNSTYEANYGFLAQELRGSESRSLQRVLAGPDDPYAAGRIFTDTNLRPGIPGYASRDNWTDRVSAIEGDSYRPGYDNFSSRNFGSWENASGEKYFDTAPTSAGPDSYDFASGKNMGSWDNATGQDYWSNGPISQVYEDHNPLASAVTDGSDQGFFGRIFSGTPLQGLFSKGGGRTYHPSRDLVQAVDQQTRVESQTELQKTQAGIKTFNDAYNRTAAAFTDYISRFIWILVGIVIVGAALAMFVFDKGETLPVVGSKIKAAKKALA